MTYKYGLTETVLVRLGLLGQTPANDLVETALKSADVFVDGKLRKARLDVPENPPYPEDLIEAANYYATAEALQPLFNTAEEYSENVSYYMERAKEFLSDYIDIEVQLQVEAETRDDLNPYSSSKTPNRIGRVYRWR